MSQANHAGPYGEAEAHRREIRERNSRRPRPDLKVGDIVVTDFYPKEASLRRKVTAIHPSERHCQTGWAVDTEASGQLLTGLDSGWYVKLAVQTEIPI